MSCTYKDKAVSIQKAEGGVQVALPIGSLKTQRPGKYRQKHGRFPVWTKLLFGIEAEVLAPSLSLSLSVCTAFRPH